jgi:CheY-like chemotaxis protein
MALEVRAIRPDSMFKILYIEDTENNRILVTRYLNRNGYHVLTAEDAAQGLALALTDMPDLILMDLGLPGTDGWTATRHFKSNPVLQHIPIIALTAHVMQGDREKALEAGCDDYDTKPFQFARLMDKIDALLSPAAKPRPIA